MVDISSIDLLLLCPRKSEETQEKKKMLLISALFHLLEIISSERRYL